MKPYFRVTWNVLKYNLIKFFKCKNLKIRGIVLLGYNTKLQVHKTSQICIGKNVVSDGRCVIIADKNAKVEIGDKVYFNENVMISAKKNITIGNGCQFGPNVKIFDNNHQFNKEKGEKNKAIEIAKSLINLGLDKESIAKSTGLDLWEVEKLMN